jgi:hypothetical protein
MLIVVISDATPATNGRPSLVFMCFKQYGGALPALTNHTHSKQKADKSKADKSCWKKVPKQRPAQARWINVPSQRQTKARLTTTTQTKVVFKKTHAGLDHPILPMVSGHPVSPLLYRPSQPHHPKRSIPRNEKALENQNPSNMYPSGRLARSTTSDKQTRWWLDNEEEEKPGVTPTDDHLAKTPVKTHINSREEMEAYAEEKLRYVVDIDDKKDFLDIIRSAVALKSSLLVAKNHAELQEETLPLRSFVSAITYCDQELVNLSCLVDRGREFEVDTEYESRNKFAIRVDSYQVHPKRKLKSCLKKGSKHLPSHPLMIAVYKDWLKQYLDWFDPDLFEYISAHAAGMKVSTFANRLASNYDHDYKM